METLHAHLRHMLVYAGRSLYENQRKAVGARLTTVASRARAGSVRPTRSVGAGAAATIAARP